MLQEVVRPEFNLSSVPTILERDALRRQTIESGERIAKLETDVEQVKIARIEATRECQSMRASLSWKLTWPLRALRDTIETISKKAKNRLPG
jgi:hypothetical protein